MQKIKIHKYSYVVIFILVINIAFFIFTYVYASQGTAYKIDNPEAMGPSNNTSSSTNFNILSEIGDTVVGTSTSVNFNILHGVTYEDSSDLTLDIIAVPEKRVPTTGNDDSHVIIEVRSPGNTTPLFQTTVDTDVNGEKTGIILSGISAGTYDLTAKAYSHLRRKKTMITLGTGSNTVDFSDVGTNKLLCGDVNLAEGDNKVNSLDVTILVDDWFTTDERTDLNQDGEVNSIDITNMINNFNQVGDE